MTEQVNKYQLKTYESGFENEMAKIGSKVTESWLGYNMTSAEGIKRNFSSDNFDPETRIYAFKGDEMVGFTTGYVYNPEKENVAHVRLPMIKKGYEEVVTLLMEKTVEVYKSKGVKKIETGLSETWGNQIDLATEYGFTLLRENNKFAIADLNQLNVPETKSEHKVQEIDMERDKKALIDIFENSFGLSKERAEQNYELINSNAAESQIAHSAIFEDSKIIARSLMYKPDASSEEAYLGSIFASAEKREEFSNILLSHAFEKAKEKGVKTINKSLIGNDQIPDFEKYGFAFTNSYTTYSKDI